MPVVGAYITGLNGSNGGAISQQLLASTLNRYVFWALHVNESGDLSYNNDPIVTGGVLQSPSGTLVQQLIGQARAQGVTEFFFSIGGWGVGDWPNIEAILNQGGTAQANLFANLAVLAQIGITGLDYDYEQPAMQDPVGTMASFSQLVATKLSFQVSFCPFGSETELWIPTLQKIHAAMGSQPVVAFNVQFYAGGAPNDFGQWVSQLQGASGTGVSDAATFVQPGLAVASSGSGPAMDPGEMTSWLQSNGVTGGAWLWQSEEVVTGGSYTIAQYATAIGAGL